MDPHFPAPRFLRNANAQPGEALTLAGDETWTFGTPGSGERALTFNEARVNGGAVDRNVTLPDGAPLAAMGGVLVLLLLNVGTTKSITFKDNGGASVATVTPGETALVVIGSTTKGAVIKGASSSYSIPDGGLLSLLGAGTGVGDVVMRIGGSPTEGLETIVFEATVTPAAIETALITVPAKSVLRAVQSNVQAALTGGGTTDSYGIGTAADPDKYNSSATLTQNSKTDWCGAAQLTASEAIILTGTAGQVADGDTALTVGSVRVRVVYDTVNQLDDNP